MTPIFYPRLIRRVRAVLIDSVIVPVAALGTLILGDALGVSHIYGKLALVLIPIFILEPGLVAMTGGTVGHHLLKIRVAKIDGQGNINIFAATLRFVVKLLLGSLSFIFVLTTRKHQAVHDLLARSVVIHKNPSALPAYEVLAEQTLDNASYVYPATWRRVVVIIGYWLGATIVFSIVSNIVASNACVARNQCSAVEYLLMMTLDIAWLVSLGWFTVRGWRGTLYGCMRRPSNSA